MKLSVVIVNYNVRAYLEQCLRTVFTALEGIAGEVFVVDNQSTDGSVEMVREKFPLVRLIANAENVGFSRANNQAIRLARGEYVLLLNPDTVVGEDVFRKVIAFLDAHPKAGGLGVKMIDGTGRFLPESKRGLPTPQVAFFKIIGLARLFPHSRVFGRYHLGHLPEDETAPIEILSGACMFLRKRTLDQVGLLDESFFMYGEDIDLSYRITLGGHENWYFPEARIIHYKGESTKKSSVNYVFVFYNAMAIFARKYFSRQRMDLLGLLITGSIYLSAAGAIVMRFLRRALLPVMDLSMLHLLVVLVAAVDPAVRIMPGGAVPWSLALLICFWLAGAYDRPVRLGNLLKGAMLFALVVFFHLDMVAQLRAWHWQAWPPFLTQVLPPALVGLATRTLLHLLRVKGHSLRAPDRTRVLAIGSPEENRHALALLWQTHFGLGRQEQLGTAEAEQPGAVALVRRRIRRHGIDEVVFCARDLRWERIITLMESLRRTGVMFKIAQPGREFIIGPNSIESLNDLYVLQEHSLNSPAARRAKRILDVSVAALVLLLFPIAALAVPRPRSLLVNAWDVLRGARSWVGHARSTVHGQRLPTLAPGIIDPSADEAMDALAAERITTIYAKDYSTWTDLRLIWRARHRLGRG